MVHYTPSCQVIGRCFILFVLLLLTPIGHRNNHKDGGIFVWNTCGAGSVEAIRWPFRDNKVWAKDENGEPFRAHRSKLKWSDPGWFPKGNGKNVSLALLSLVLGLTFGVYYLLKIHVPSMANGHLLFDGMFSTKSPLSVLISNKSIDSAPPTPTQPSVPLVHQSTLAPRTLHLFDAMEWLLNKYSNYFLLEFLIINLVAVVACYIVFVLRNKQKRIIKVVQSPVNNNKPSLAKVRVRPTPKQSVQSSGPSVQSAPTKMSNKQAQSSMVQASSAASASPNSDPRTRSAGFVSTWPSETR